MPPCIYEIKILSIAVCYGTNTRIIENGVSQDHK